MDLLRNIIEVFASETETQVFPAEIFESTWIGRNINVQYNSHLLKHQKVNYLSKAKLFFKINKYRYRNFVFQKQNKIFKNN